MLLLNFLLSLVEGILVILFKDDKSSSTLVNTTMTKERFKMDKFDSINSFRFQHMEM